MLSCYYPKHAAEQGEKSFLGTTALVILFWQESAALSLAEIHKAAYNPFVCVSYLQSGQLGKYLSMDYYYFCYFN